MSEMGERLARAIQAELRRQSVLYEEGEDLTRLMMQTGEAADMQALCRAIIEAIREPTAAMIDATGEPGVPDAHYRAIYTDMIDAALKVDA